MNKFLLALSGCLLLGCPRTECVRGHHETQQVGGGLNPALFALDIYVYDAPHEEDVFVCDEERVIDQ